MGNNLSKIPFESMMEHMTEEVSAAEAPEPIFDGAFSHTWNGRGYMRTGNFAINPLDGAAIAGDGTYFIINNPFKDLKM